MLPFEAYGSVSIRLFYNLQQVCVEAIVPLGI